MPKLHLKRTPAEQAEHDLRKATKAARKARKSRRRRESELSADHSYDNTHDEECTCRHPGPSSPPRYKRRRHKSREPTDILGSDEELYDHHNNRDASAHKPDYEAIRAMREEQRFREKMLNALEEDNGLQYLEERLNEWAHVPDRWRSGKKNGKGRVLDDGELDPQHMSDEEYAEWIRIGMWK
jgi:hypothetical protein